MRTVVAWRDYVTEHAIRSHFRVEGQEFHFLERPWVNNERNVSCIPAGEYLVKFLPRSASGRYKEVWHLQNVQGRSGVLIHCGNVVAHSRGCLLIGRRRGWIDGEAAVLNSRTALVEFNSIMGTDDFKLLIVGDQNVTGTDGTT